MALKSTFLNAKLRENAGAISSSRFDYQKDVSISMLLEHEENDHDYIFLFDYHEDLVIMDAENDPKKLSFFQIKGKKSGNWSLNKMIKTEYDNNKSPLLSIIGKLYECRQKFIDETQQLTFLSNARYNFTDKDKKKTLDKDLISATELCSKETEDIRDNLKMQLGLSDEPDFESLLNFKVVDISLNDSERHLKGILADFFERKHGISPDVNVIYKNFLNEVRKRSNYNKEITSFEELVKNKAITKTTFSSWIHLIAHQEKSLKEKWQQLLIILNSNPIDFFELKSLKEGWTNFELISKDPNNHYVNKTVKLIKTHLEKTTIPSNQTLLQFVNETYSIIREGIPSTLNDEYTTKAMILNQLY